MTTENPLRYEAPWHRVRGLQLFEVPVNLLSMFSTEEKTYTVMCCLYSTEPPGCYAWGKKYESLREAENFVEGKFPEARTDERVQDLYVGHNLGDLVYDQGLDVVVIYDVDSGLVESMFQVGTKKPF